MSTLRRNEETVITLNKAKENTEIAKLPYWAASCRTLALSRHVPFYLDRCRTLEDAINYRIELLALPIWRPAADWQIETYNKYCFEIGVVASDIDWPNISYEQATEMLKEVKELIPATDTQLYIINRMQLCWDITNGGNDRISAQEIDTWGKYKCIDYCNEVVDSGSFYKATRMEIYHAWKKRQPVNWTVISIERAYKELNGMDSWTEEMLELVLNLTEEGAQNYLIQLAKEKADKSLTATTFEENDPTDRTRETEARNDDQYLDETSERLALIARLFAAIGQTPDPENPDVESLEELREIVQLVKRVTGNKRVDIFFEDCKYFTEEEIGFCCK